MVNSSSIKFQIIIVLFFFLIGSLYAQFNNPVNHEFNYKVKLLDEFIERFNFDTSGFLVVEMRKQGLSTTRNKMMESLFNQEQNWDSSLIKRFINSVLYATPPVLLNENDADWYAEVNSKFELKSKMIDVFLLLKPDFDSENFARWRITGIVSDSLFKPRSGKDTDTVRKSEWTSLDGSFIRPMSHEINFIDFFRVFKPGNQWDEIAGTSYELDKLTCFFSLIDAGALTYIQNDKIKFHFLQIPGWYFCIEYFHRTDINSGWLISDLRPFTETEKRTFKLLLMNDN